MIQTNKPLSFSICKDSSAKNLNQKYYVVLDLHKEANFFSFYEFLPLPKGMFFDSSMKESDASKWSFFGIQPGKKITPTIAKDNDFLEIIQNELFEQSIIPAEIKEIPFIAGYMGFISYEKSFEESIQKKSSSSTFPEYQFQYYDGSINFNHLKNQITLITSDIETYETIIEQYQNFHFQKVNAKTPSAYISRPKAQLSKSSYIEKINEILENIKCGNIYQANFTHQLVADFQGEPLALYRALRKFNPSPYSCFYQLSEDQYILSSSPERLFKIENRTIISNPIKGTIKRLPNSSQDENQKKQLLNSTKDRAELAMIVDLIRNDLGRICTFGSVQVNQWPILESFQKVHHLIGEVQGELKPNTTLKELFSSIFPGGSITGAPKIRSMEIIEILEETSRGPYTGSIGYIDLRGNMEFNILIRTVLIEKGKLTLQVGGGIVIDSNPEKEYEESMQKAEAILDALNQFKDQH